MSNDYLPFFLVSPEVKERRKEPPRRPPVAPELIAKRAELARVLLSRLESVSEKLTDLTDEQRKAVFLKLTHDRPINLVGTDLKPVSEPSRNFTLAVPKSDSLDKLISKVQAFGEGELKKGHAPNEDLGAYLKDVQEGKPTDRLSQELFENYESLVKQPWVICEVELMSLEQGRTKQRQELDELRQELGRALGNGVHGTIFEHEEIKGTCRAVIRCTGAMFKKLVEDKNWQTKIFWFEPRPKYESFSTTLSNFNVSALGEITSPDPYGPVVCVIDSGITEGNPFLTAVVPEGYNHSFLSKKKDDPSDEYGHGSGVASLAAFYALNIAAGAVNEGRVWVAGARVLDENNEGDERLLSKGRRSPPVSEPAWDRRDDRGMIQCVCGDEGRPRDATSRA